MIESHYGPHAQQTVDLHPAHGGAQARGSFTVIGFHGGGWARGDKRRPYGTMLFSEHFVEVLTAEGIDVLMANYRLASDTLNVPPQHPFDTRFPGAHEDALAVTAWARARAADLHLAWPAVLMGESAGTLLAAWAALHPTSDALGLFSVGGVSVLTRHLGAFGPFAAHYLDGARGQRASLLTHPQRHKVPVLIWHGAQDGSVPVEQAQALFDSCWPRSAVMRVVEGAPHTGPSFATSLLDKELVAFVENCSTQASPA